MVVMRELSGVGAGGKGAVGWLCCRVCGELGLFIGRDEEAIGKGEWNDGETKIEMGGTGSAGDDLRVVNFTGVVGERCVEGLEVTSEGKDCEDEGNDKGCKGAKKK